LAITNDYLVAALAGAYESQNNLGFASSSQVRNFNLTTNVGEPFTGFNQIIRNLPNPALRVGNLTFPLQPPNQDFPTAIEIGFDENLVSPINYSWNLTYERTLPAGLIVSVSYIGRRARNLLQSRDAAAIANFVDTESGMDWNTGGDRAGSSAAARGGCFDGSANSLFRQFVSGKFSCAFGMRRQL
jgi:hypothetical protein